MSSHGFSPATRFPALTRLLPIAFILAACGGGQSSGDAGTDASTDSITLALHCQGSPASIQQAPLPSGHVFYAVDLTLENGSASSIPLEGGFFVLTTTDGLQYYGDAAAIQYPHLCDPNASVAPHARVECAMVFVLPTGAVPANVGYMYADQAQMTTRTITADASMLTNNLCSGQCVDFQTDPMNCGSCGTVSPSGHCDNGTTSCATGTIDCGHGCQDISSDAMNCGACGHVCTDNMYSFCFHGQCAAEFVLTQNLSCLHTCTGLTCIGGEAFYGGCQAEISCSETPPDTMACGGSFYMSYCYCVP